MPLSRNSVCRTIAIFWLYCAFAILPKLAHAGARDDIQAFFSNTEFHWEVDLGLMLNHRRDVIDTNDQSNADIAVNLWLSGGAYYGRFFLESAPVLSRPLTFGYTLKQTEHKQINLITGSFFDEISPLDQTSGNRLDGILIRQSSTEGGVEINHQSNDTFYNFRLMHDLRSRHGGTILSAQVSQQYFTATTLIQPAFGIALIDSSATNYYYGVEQIEVREDRVLYEAGAAWIASASVYLERPLNKSWSMVTRLSYSHSSSGITNSPLVNQDGSYNIHFGMMWVF